MSEINEGVRILAERMKTNPEEFQEGYSRSKWAQMVNTAVTAEWLTGEERQLINNAVTSVRRANFTAQVLKTLTEDPAAYQLKEEMMYPQMGTTVSVMGADAIARSTGVAITGPNFAGATGAIAAVDYERR